MSREVVFAPNWLGDAVMSLPALADVVRASAPGSVDVAAASAIAPMFSLVPGLGEVVSLRRDSSDVDAIRRRGYEAALLFPNSFRSAYIARRAGISERWGYRADWRGLLLTRSVTAPVHVHQVDYYQALVRGLGFPNGPATPRLEVSTRTRTEAEELLARSGWDRRTPLVAVAPGAAYGGAKRWPAASFAAVVETLASDQVRSVLVGGQGDAAAGREVLARFGSSIDPSVRPLNLIGQTDLPALAGVLVQCRAVVSNDSGAMHVAAALGLAVTALFGPTNEFETSPRGSGRQTVLTSAVWCRPCMLRECPLTHRCMRGISVEAVIDAARSAG